MKDGDGFGIRNSYSISELTNDDIKEIIRNIGSNYGYSEERVRTVLQNLGIRSENMLGINIAAELERGADNNAVGNAKGRRRGSLVGNKRSGESGRKDKGEIQFMKTPDGEVYGFTYKGKIYIDKTKINPDVPIHEYTHLWDNIIQQAKPELWERGVELLKECRCR